MSNVPKEGWDKNCRDELIGGIIYGWSKICRGHYERKEK